MDWMPQAIRDGIIVILVVSGPLVMVAAAIGLVIGILQAATQVQEQTIGSALKIIGVFALIIIAGFWMYQYLNQYTSRTISSAFTFVPKQTQKAVPSNAFNENAGEKINPIENKLPEAGGVAPGVPYLGTPEIPQPPPVAKILPPSIPKIPVQPIKPDIPLTSFQEPKAPVQEPKAPVQEPKAPVQPLIKNENPIPQNPGNEDEYINGQEINLIPGDPVKNMEKNSEVKKAQNPEESKVEGNEDSAD